ncbi:peptidase U32 family protein [Methanopyrus kandleri]|uniref:Predicted protease related to collagenase n=2 Tax=Methanopyrus kandleri TaxID=2320 RepID=Q8TZB6_METKA|nr:peptidase U32 family protein [Methanopyrus kandleri]AAM01236.1 Predicted protease related to collagenase [Methanopyrus kandleri AV19]HII70844.1 U32 family peptidase [Methanopyrus kandleri]
MFSVPSPGDPALTDRLLRSLPTDRIETVYFGLPIAGTGRATPVQVDTDTATELAEVCHSYSVEPEAVINPLCTADVVCSRNAFAEFERTLDDLDDAGIERLVLSDPLMIHAAVERGFRVSVSCVVEVNTPERARYFDEIGVEEITLDTNVNRRLDTIEAIASEVSARLRIIVNEGCLPDCPYRASHFCLFSHATRPGEEVAEDPYFVRCISERVNNPTLIIKSPFVRPEDLSVYMDLGVRAFKIAGRANSITWIRRAVRAYLRGRYDGNLLDILDCPTVLRHLYHVDNRELDGFLKRVGRCDRRCSKCGFCAELAERAVEPLGGLEDAEVEPARTGRVTA